MPDIEDNPEGFIAECQGPFGLFGVFEDDGDTGYLYLYDGKEILEHHWVYNRRSDNQATESNTEVSWSDEDQEFVVKINKIPPRCNTSDRSSQYPQLNISTCTRTKGIAMRLESSRNSLN